MSAREAGRMNRLRPSILLATLASLALASPAAAAPDSLVVADPAASQVTALDGTIVWVTRVDGLDALMQKTDAGVARVQTSPRAKYYTGIDLGHDARGRLVLSYLRCGSLSSCKPMRDDLAGHRASLHGLVPKHCRLTTGPAIWGKRTAVGGACSNTRRTGLYLKTGGTLRQLPLPKDALKFDIRGVTSVDITGSRVGGILWDVYSYAFVETTGGKPISSAMTADQEGDDDGSTVGFAMTGTTAWVLSTFAHGGDPNESDIVRLTPACDGYEALPNATEAEEGFKATDIAADGSKLYLLQPGVGIALHTFAPQHPCTS